MNLEYKILWLDDHIEEFIADRHIQRIEKFLEEEGFEAQIVPVQIISDFFEKLDNSFDLILTDFHMKEMNGDEVVKKIRKEGHIFTEILFYTAQADLTNTDKLDRILFLQTTKNHHKQVVDKVKDLISLTIQKFHDIVVMRGMIMNETSDMDNQKLEMIKKYINNSDSEKTKDLKLDILNQINTSFSDKLKYVDGDWKTKDNGLKKLMKDSFVFSADYKIKTLSWILNDLSETDFSQEYQDEIIKVRNKFAHAKLEEEKDEAGKVIRKYFKHGEDGMTFDEALCKTIRTNIRKHKENLKTLQQKFDE
ncbi:response regulator [Sulfurimonas sp.]|uniref:response regulator n=1 Tax=Sulfurimonas sp. TaxID=2022749 RepID=UPI0025CCFE7C|nr:response regulator [Sulfurimonas sp.]MBW6488479.1 response regulator [Sulfurimonas sp.]